MFKITTTEGTLVSLGESETGDRNGLTTDQAQASVADRNKRAEEMGLKVRYEARDLAA